MATLCLVLPLNEVANAPKWAAIACNSYLVITCPGTFRVNGPRWREGPRYKSVPEPKRICQLMPQLQSVIGLSAASSGTRCECDADSLYLPNVVTDWVILITTP